jgi:hypothetical protein
MSKPNIEIDDFDFGFTTLSEEELKLREKIVIDGATGAANAKLEQMYKLILPLLNNLAKDADTNEYIKWPNRGAKIKQFIEKLDQIRNSA